MDIHQFASAATSAVIHILLNVAAAGALWFIGRRLISLGLRLLEGALDRHSVEPTLSRYACRSLSIVLNVALVISVLGFFGVQTTTFAALIAAGGVAVGIAWSGLLANFAAGVFLIALRPFKVGDAISAAGVNGVVEGIGLFCTAINSADNVLTLVGNNRIFSENVQNYSANAYRRVDLTATIGHAVDHDRAIQLLRRRLSQIPHVLAVPPPEVDVLEWSPAGPVLCIRPYCHQRNYWQVYFDAMRATRETFVQAGFPAPMPGLAVVQTSSPSVVARAPAV